MGRNTPTYPGGERTTLHKGSLYPALGVSKLSPAAPLGLAGSTPSQEAPPGGAPQGGTGRWAGSSQTLPSLLARSCGWCQRPRLIDRLMGPAGA